MHICIEFGFTCYLKVKKFKYNTSAANVDLMIKALSQVDWESILDTLNSNDAWVLFNAIFQDALC